MSRRKNRNHRQKKNKGGKRSSEGGRRRSRDRGQSDPRGHERSRDGGRDRGRSRGRGDREGRRASPSGPSHTGRIQKNPRGFAFVIPEDPVLPDAYIDRGQASKLMNRDRIAFSYERHRGKVSARVLKILERAQKTLLGRARRIGSRYVLETIEGEYPLDLGGRRVPDNYWITAYIDEYPTAASAGRVRLKEIFGANLEPKHDYEIAISQFDLTSRFPGSVEPEIDRCYRMAEDPGELERRRDLREVPLVTIDGADAKDFDDAVAVERDKDGGGFVLYVAIADVSYYVRRGSPLDEEARARGTSVYFPGFCLPMLPEALSNDLCSLRPRERRMALTAEITFDRHGEPVRSRFYTALIQTHARLTYEEVQGVFDKNPALLRKYDRLLGPIDLMRALYRLLTKKRKERGVLDFDLPECRITLDEEGFPIDSFPAARYDSHKLIEEFMIAANRAVARELKQQRVPSLYRVHEAPELEELEEINLLLRNLGISHRIERLSPKDFSLLLERIKDHPAAQTLHSIVLRSQKQARYDPRPMGHFGLALKDYTHFTSPIRRYPDLVVHRALKLLIGRGKGTDKRYEDAELEKLGLETSRQERTAMEAERFVVKRKQCHFMSERIGDEFDAQVSSAGPEGLFIAIPKFAIEGFLPIEALRGFYEYDERKLALVSRPGGRRLQVGAPIRVFVEEVSIDDGKIWFGEVK